MNKDIGRYNAQLVLDRYAVPDDELLNQEHYIKPFSEGSEGRKPVSMLIGTDGAAKGAGQTPDRKSFAGWGFYALMTYSSGRSSVATFSGYRNGESFMFNDNALTAELVAIREALKFVKNPTNLKIVTDCRHAIQMVKDHSLAEAQLAELKSKPSEQVTRRDRDDIKNLTIMTQISSLIRSRKVLGLSIQWVGSHVIDDLMPDEIPRIEDGETLEEQRLLAHILVNNAADGLANEGVRSAINASLRGLRHLTPGTSEWQNKTKVASKNFYYSTKTTRYAEDFLAGQQPGFMPKETIEAVLGSKSVQNIDRLRKEMLEEANRRFDHLPKAKRKSALQIERDRLRTSHEHLSAFANVEAKELGVKSQKTPRPDGKVVYRNPKASVSDENSQGKNRDGYLRLRKRRSEAPGLG